MKPIIGITAKFTHSLGASGSYTTGGDYVSSITAAGGLPLLLPEGDEQNAVAMANRCDGILIPGGGDLHPLLFGEEPLPLLHDMRLTLDRFEIALIRAAASQGKPIFGICRGIQVINVAFGGSLWQDLPSQCSNAFSHVGPTDARNEPFHRIYCTEHSLMRRIFGESIMTNSFHHQAVKEVAPGFAVTAQTTEGVIEAIEQDGGLIFGVQFHLENFSAHDQAFASLFEAFVDLCRSRKMPD